MTTLVELDRGLDLELTDPVSGYRLHVQKNNSDLGLVHFWIPTPNFPQPICYGSPIQDAKIPVTAKSIIEYPIGITGALTHSGPIGEIGPGLGMFIPSVAEFAFGHHFPPPLAIDPFNYSLAEDMLREARANTKIKHHQKEHIDEVLRRIRIITDPNKVNLINSTLGQAICEFPQIRRSLDILVDSCSALTYSETELFTNGELNIDMSRNLLPKLVDHVYALEQSLLKPYGRLIHNLNY